MAVQFILGRAGTGKTQHCFASVEQWVKLHGLAASVLLITPRQATQVAERQLIARTPGRSLLGVRVVSPDTLVREIAPQLAESLDLMDGRGRRLLIALAIQRHASELKYFKAAQNQPHLAARIDAALAEVEQASTTLDDIAKAIGPTASGAKLHDLAILQHAYTKLLAGRLDRHLLEERVIDAIRSSRLVAQSLVVIDGFADLTPMQRRVFVALGSSARRTEIALLLDDPSDEQDMLFARTRRTYHRLKAELGAAHATIEPDIRLGRPHRFISSDLAELEACFVTGTSRRRSTSTSGETSPGVGGIRVIEAATDLEEVRFAAEQIRRWQMAGVRLRDIGVFCRGLEPYAQWVRPILREYGIPCFVDQSHPLSEHPLIRYIRSAIRIVMERWRRNSVLELLKCGLSPLEPHEADRLENLALRHGIDGNGWLKQWDFLSPPDDEDDPQACREREECEICSRYRDAVVTLLQPLHDLWTRDEILAADLAKTLGNLINAKSVEAQLARWSGISEESAQEQQQCLQAVQELLAAAESLLPDPLPPRQLAGMLLAAMEDLTVKLAPPTLDQVLVGQIDRSRSPEFSHVILLGMNEGTFPARATEDSIFSDTERVALESAGIELNPASSSRAIAEQLIGYIAFTRPSHELLLTRPRADEAGRKLSPSGFLGRVRAILPHIETEQAVLAANPRISAGRAAEYANHPKLSPEVARQLLGDQLTCSATRIELFAACPFRHFLERSLRLQEREVAEISSLDLGNAFHNVLQELGRRMIDGKLEWSDDEIDAQLDELIAQVSSELRGQILLSSQRNQYLLSVIKRMLLKLRRDQVLLSAGGYKVSATEMTFGESDSELPALKIATPKGRRVQLRGRIDRIDAREEGAHKTYLVFDYKSSAKQLSLCALEQGLTLQLMIYWLVLQENGKPVDGALYQQLMRPMGSESAPKHQDPDAVLCKPRGVLNADALGRLDPGLVDRSKLFSVQVKKGGGSLANENSNDAMRPSDLSALCSFIRQKLGELADRIFDGEIAISPYQLGTTSACPYCAYRAVCRFDTRYNRYREIAPAKRTEVLQRISGYAEGSHHA